MCRRGSAKCQYRQATSSLYPFGFSAERRIFIARFRSRCSAFLSAADNTGGFLPRKVAIFFTTFFVTGFTTFNKRSARGFASSAEVVATTAIDAVTVTAPGDGKFATI